VAGTLIAMIGRAAERDENRKVGCRGAAGVGQR